MKGPGSASKVTYVTLAGNDTVDSGGLSPGVIQLFVDGALQ